MRKEYVYEIYPKRMSPSLDYSYQTSHLKDRYVFNSQLHRQKFEYHYYYEDNHLLDCIYQHGIFTLKNNLLTLFIFEEFSWRLGDSFTYGTEHQTYKDYRAKPLQQECFFLNTRRTLFRNDEKAYIRLKEEKACATFHNYNDDVKRDVKRLFGVIPDASR
jgi:hypothetical protein